MGRDMVKVRKVGQSIVVTLTQDVLNEVEIEEGDRLLLEPIPPRRIVISKEPKKISSTRRLELELEVLENKRDALKSDQTFLMKQWHLSMPVDERAKDPAVFDLSIEQINLDISRIEVEISEKKLALFDAQGD